MALSDGWAKLVAPDAPWVESTRAFLGPVKTCILYSHPTLTSFFRQWDVMANNLLSFYAPDLPASARQNASLPLMDGKDALMVVLAYLVLVGLSLLLVKGSSSEQTDVKKKEAKSVLAKMGPVFAFQAIYNIAQVVACGFVVFRIVDVLFTEQYSFLCNRFNAPSPRMAHVTWLFYMLKYVDLLDTAFMILRGNWRQVSFLHVYHHSSVIYIFWVNASVGYDGDIYYVVFLNGFVHVVMYAYYFMASFNIPLARMVKMFVTQLQMAQFLAMIGHAFYHIFWHSKCQYPVRISTGYLIYVISLFFLFRNFSQKTYTAQGAKPTKVKATKSD